MTYPVDKDQPNSGSPFMLGLWQSIVTQCHIYKHSSMAMLWPPKTHKNPAYLCHACPSTHTHTKQNTHTTKQNQQHNMPRCNRHIKHIITKTQTKKQKEHNTLFLTHDGFSFFCAKAPCPAALRRPKRQGDGGG